jgi:hypothetical protein
MAASFRPSAASGRNRGIFQVKSTEIKRARRAYHLYMDIFRLVLFTAILVIAIALMRSLRALADLRLWRRLTRNQPVRVKDAQPGPVIVRGRVRALREPLPIPNSKDTCIAYEISEPIRVRTTRQAVEFVVEDESGSIEVRPSYMRVGAPVDHVLYVDNIGMKTLPGLARPIRILREGDEVVVVGVAQREADVGGQAGNYRDAPTKLVIRPGGGVGLAAVRDVASLMRYAVPTLVITAIVIAAALAGVGVGGWAMFGHHY